MTRPQLYQRQRMQQIVYVRTKERVAQEDELPTCCSHFACGRKLSLAEQLAGTKCTQHMNIKPINITSTIKRP